MPYLKIRHLFLQRNLERQMAKKEKSTDFWVYDLLKHAEISDKFSVQGSSILEIDNALKTASKSKTGNVGMPEFVGVVKDFLIVIEDKKEHCPAPKIQSPRYYLSRNRKH